MILKLLARTGHGRAGTGNGAFPKSSSIGHREVTSAVRAGLQGVRCRSGTSWVKLENIKKMFKIHFKKCSNRGSRSLIFKGGQQMALMVLYVVICP